MSDRLADYNVIWDSPSQNESGSMPLGNGDFAANVWVEPSGDLLLLLAKSDAWDENSINLKLGRIRLKFTPNPLIADSTFRQTLDLRTARIEIVASFARIQIWVDANEPVIRIEVDADQNIQVQASLEIWRTSPRTIKTQTSDMFKNLIGKDSDPHPTVIWPDQVLHGDGEIIWCHHNAQRNPDPYEINMKLQGLGDFLERMPHPLRGRTFGAAMVGDGFGRVDALTLKSSDGKRKHRLSIYAQTLHPATTEQWQQAMNATIQRINQLDYVAAWRNHQRWWDEFWSRSWIYITADSDEEARSAFHITQSYILQRFMNAAAGRVSPIKHNGSLFSVGMPDDPDFRRWGGPGFWFQNQRLIYWPMLAAGDFDLMSPWLKMYLASLPLQRHRTEKYFRHSGAHYPETITFWGAEISAHYGWTPFEQRARPEAECAYLTYYWSGGIELTLILLEYFAHTTDKDFARDALIPIADAILEFFDLHYPRDFNGNIRFEPAQALETWHHAVNPVPEIAGLRYLIPKMLELPLDFTTTAQRQRWSRMLEELPDIPTGERDSVPVILPAGQFDTKKNTENPELYCVFPYRLFGLAKPNLELACNTFNARLNRAAECWSQDDIQMALLGMTDQAREWLTRRASPAAHSQSRFPAFWNAFHDWIPDVDHAGVLQLALQFMLLQCNGQEISLLPAWPREWNADFKLHAPGNIIVQGTVRDGRIIDMNISPPEARNLVNIPS
jgi:alpha-L-fucosidase 2